MRRTVPILASGLTALTLAYFPTSFDSVSNPATPEEIGSSPGVNALSSAAPGRLLTL